LIKVKAIQHFLVRRLRKYLFKRYEKKVKSIKEVVFVIIAGVPGEKPLVTSDKLPDSPSKFPCIQL